MKVQRADAYAPFKERQRQDKNKGSHVCRTGKTGQADGTDAHKQYTCVREDPLQSLNDR
jgi:hypothetical protein